MQTKSALSEFLETQSSTAAPSTPAELHLFESLDGLRRELYICDVNIRNDPNWNMFEGMFERAMSDGRVTVSEFNVFGPRLLDALATVQKDGKPIPFNETRNLAKSIFELAGEQSNPEVLSLGERFAKFL